MNIFKDLNNNQLEWLEKVTEINTLIINNATRLYYLEKENLNSYNEQLEKLKSLIEYENILWLIY